MTVEKFVKKLMKEVEKKNSWGKNKLRELIVKIMIEGDE